jgi:hypothetical protein
LAFGQFYICFTRIQKIPKWVNVALGYGAEGMISGRNDETEPLIQLSNPQMFVSILSEFDVV